MCHERIKNIYKIKNRLETRYVSDINKSFKRQMQRRIRTYYPISRNNFFFSIFEYYATKVEFCT